MSANRMHRAADDRHEKGDPIRTAIGVTIPQAIAAGVLFSVLVYIAMILGGKQ